MNIRKKSVKKLIVNEKEKLVIESLQQREKVFKNIHYETFARIPKFLFICWIIAFSELKH